MHAKYTDYRMPDAVLTSGSGLGYHKRARRSDAHGVRIRGMHPLTSMRVFLPLIDPLHRTYYGAWDLPGPRIIRDTARQ